MNIFYVYEHWRPDKNVCFWVGKGKGRRARNFSRNDHYNKIVKKLERLDMGVDVRIIRSDLSETDAHKLEVERIAFWRGVHNELANKTNGGEGVSGLKMPASAIEKLRLAKRGFKHSKETKKKIAAAGRGRIQGAVAREKLRVFHTGRKQGPHTPEHCAKIATGNRGKKDSAETMARKKAAQQNRSPEMLAKLSAALTGRKLSAEHCKNLSIAWKDRAPFSEEAIAKMRASQKLRRAITPVSAETKAKQSASIKAWHAQRRLNAMNHPQEH